MCLFFFSSWFLLLAFSFLKEKANTLQLPSSLIWYCGELCGEWNKCYMGF